jgi:hypothetical protein
MMCTVIPTFLAVLTPEALQGIRRTRRLLRRIIIDETFDQKIPSTERSKEKARAKEPEATQNMLDARIRREQKARIMLEDEERPSGRTDPTPLKLLKFAVCADARPVPGMERSVRFGDGLWVGKRLFTSKTCPHNLEVDDANPDNPLVGEDLDTVTFFGGSFLVDGVESTEEAEAIEQVLEFLVSFPSALISLTKHLLTLEF